MTIKNRIVAVKRETSIEAESSKEKEKSVEKVRINKDYKKHGGGLGKGYKNKK